MTRTSVTSAGVSRTTVPPIAVRGRAPSLPTPPPVSENITESGLENRAEAATKRKAAYGLERTKVVGGRNFLRRRKVSRPVETDYHARHNRFKEWLLQSRVAANSMTLLDLALSWYLVDMFFEGFPSAQASKTLVGIAFCRNVQHPKLNLWRSYEAATGYSKLAPSKSRLPLPYLAILLIVGRLLLMGCKHAAWATMFSVIFYLRPRETLSLTIASLFRPVKTKSSQSPWGVVLFPNEDGLVSKTGTSDQSLLADSSAYPWQAIFLERLSKEPKGRRLFDLKHEEWLKLFRAAAALEHLNQFGTIVLHMLRHTGASHEMFTGAKTLEQIKKRGRWLSDRNLGRYERGLRIPQLIGRMTDGQRTAASKLEKKIGLLLARA